MILFIGMDDTDIVGAPCGTGKLARRLAACLPEGCRVTGVVRQQHLVADAVPYTSHNSSACIRVQLDDRKVVAELIQTAVDFVRQHACTGSDPGVCVAVENAPALADLINFGMASTRRILTQKEALQAARSVHLSGHGGTNDGIIGAAAAVGLTACGWCGRYIELDNLRDIPEKVRVAALQRRHMQVVSTDRDARVPGPDDWIVTHRWIRPRLLGHRPVVLVVPKGPGIWEHVGEKRNGGHAKVVGFNPPDAGARFDIDR
jgi:hypothetical protein